MMVFLLRLLLLVAGLSLNVHAASTEVSVTLPTCAEKCLFTAIAQSPCSPTDLACTCSNQPLALRVEKCIHVACSIKDQLGTKNYTMTTCGAPVRDKRLEHLVVPGAFYILSVVALILRIISRVVSSGGFQSDDYVHFVAMVGSTMFAACSIPLYIFGIGKDLWTLSPENITNVLFSFFHGEWTYIVSICLTKVSIICLYLRIFPAKTFRVCAYTLLTLIVLYCTVFELISIFQCTPVRGAWEHWHGEEHFTCRNVNAQGWACAIFNLVLDLGVIILPVQPLANLVMAKRKRLQLVLMFSVGIVVSICSIVRLWTLVKFANTTNFTWDYLAMGVWSQIEVHLGNFCACMPAMYSLFKKLWPRMFSSVKAVYSLESSRQRGSRKRTSQKPKDVGDEHNFVRLVNIDRDPESVRGGKS